MPDETDGSHELLRLAAAGVGKSWRALVDRGLTVAGEEAVRLERKPRLQDALNARDPLDREVLAPRHFEPLSPVETARVLGIKENADGRRYVRAPQRSEEILSGPGGDWLEP
jgi:DNA-directed RNA polymerase specialized sigma24 family protein